MKKTFKYSVILIAAMIILGGCSHKGIHMSKHRKSRKCNCPTFAENTAAQISEDKAIAIQL